MGYVFDDGCCPHGKVFESVSSPETTPAGVLDEAWAAAEKALPEGWAIRRLERWPGQDWEVVAVYPLGGFVKGNGPTPAAALHALAAALGRSGSDR